MTSINDKSTLQKSCGNCSHPDREHCHVEKVDSSGVPPVTGSCKMEGCGCEMLMPEKQSEE